MKRNPPPSLARLLLSLVTACALLAPARPAAAAADQPAAVEEYQLKAAFIFHFAQFVDWPREAFANEHSPLVVGLVGNDVFRGKLQATLKDKVVQNRPVVFRRFADAHAVDECHLLFVSPSERHQLRPILNRLQGRPVLTVGDVDEFLRDGGIIRFWTKDAKLRFQVRTRIAEEAGLKINSRLLRLADLYPE